MGYGSRAAGAGGPSVAEYVIARAGDDHAGLVFEDRTWTWSEVVAEASVRASVLRRLRGDGPFHVGVLLENIPEYVFLLLGAALAGATVVGINSTRRGAELERDIRHTDCQIILTDVAQSGLLGGLATGPPAGQVFVIDGPDYLELLAHNRPAPLPEALPVADALYLLLFTAGSTGAPKAVRMSQGRAAGTAGESARAFGAEDVLYCAMPLFHGNALLTNLLPALISGASVVLRRRFSASGFLPDVRRHGCTFFNYVGRTLSYVLAVPESPDDADNRLRWALGSEASPQNIAEFTRRFCCPVFEGYGSSENAVVIAPGPGTPPTALGRPKKGIDVAILDPATGAECATALLGGDGALLNPAEAIGEIVGRNTLDRFEGYYNNPEADAERTRGGWYWTGDLGYRDAEGFVYFAGRTADWIRVDGENFAGGSVERILNRYPVATGVAVYGVPDPLTGDQVMAALEMREPAAFDPDDFAAFLAHQSDLGTKWSPRFVTVLAQLPVTGAGKVDKAPLRAAAWELAAPVWWRPGTASHLRRLSPADVAALRGRFVSCGRERLLPGVAPG
ncbi:MAG: AMP-binding protein [Acidimicrobiales bacterium]